ncbi:MAG: hypothetical protein ABSB76_31410 [Streptosporangiaceae bacterium]
MVWQRPQTSIRTSTCPGPGTGTGTGTGTVCLTAFFFGVVSLWFLPTSWRAAGRKFFDPGGRRGPGAARAGAGLAARFRASRSWAQAAMTSQVHHNAMWKSVIAAEDPAVARRF